MNNETPALAKVQKKEISLNVANLSPFEAAAFGGDLSKLNHEERGMFLAKVHESCGLNPLTGGFQLLLLNGKMVLYATKGVTNQLSKLHKLNVTVTTPKLEAGLLVCHATATTPDGRSDSDIGAVPYAESMGAADKANCMMKVVTKAKRRVILSLCGLGMIDESEFETIAPERIQRIEQPKVNINNLKPAQGADVTEAASSTEKPKPVKDWKPLEKECHDLIAELYGCTSKAALWAWLQQQYGKGCEYDKLDWTTMHGQLVEAKKQRDAQPKADVETGEVVDEPAFNDNPES